MTASGVFNSSHERMAWSGCSLRSRVPPRSSSSKAPNRPSVGAPILPVVFFSTMTPRPIAAAGAPWPFAAIAIRWLLSSAAKARIAAKADRRSWLKSLHVFRFLPLRPWIVVVREVHPVSQGRVTVEPELDKRRWIRVRQIVLSHHLKRMRRCFRSIRHNSMNYFQAVNVRRMFLHSANSVANRLAQERKDIGNQQQHCKRRPIALSTHAPGRPPMFQDPLQGQIRSIKSEEHPYHAKGKSLKHMAERVMPQFVSHHRQQFIGI